MDKVCLNSDAVGDEEGESNVHVHVPVAPAVGMEFESYEDVYYFYNWYAKEQGFGIRVTNTWYRKTKERYRAKLSCSSAGFKKRTEANRPRPETRTGCPAMIKFRLMDSTRWRIIEVELDHNHLINPTSGKFYKSHKQVALGSKRTFHFDATAAQQVHKIRMFRTLIIDAEDDASVHPDEGKSPNPKGLYSNNQLKLKKGDAEAILNFFSHQQLADPDFFYVVDVNERGCFRNLFWADAKSRVAYSYFSDVVAIDTTCLNDAYEVPLVMFLGINHHKQSILFGCGLLACETVESYTWLFRAWLTCILGRPPQVIITNQCGILQTVVADVFPRSTHCLCLFNIMQKVPEKLGACVQYEAINAALSRAVYSSLRAEEFEATWEDMMKSSEIRGNKWLQSLYEERKRWAPVYLKEIFLAGIFSVQQSDDAVSFFFDGYLDEQTSLKEFLEKYDQTLQTKRQLEALADLDSKSCSFAAKSRSYFELQVSKLYSNEILRMFEREVEGMFSCFNSRQINVDGAVMTYIVEEQVEVEGNHRGARDYEVCYNEAEMEVFCICGMFNFRGYLCRHALFILSQNGIKEIPTQYIVSRWRKDMKRSNVYDHNSSGIDISNPVHRYDHLYRQIVKVVEEGKKSHDHYETALQAMENILRKLHIVNVEDPDNIMSKH
ncbi:protein FAR1-RELATED SEQUENCE 6-like isoform X1 [Vigna umbellata]|uniref:protein FAR1-RELATED SEQUENCE 6-like isoform X1 n=2 Tax=Vigna umbellata TaxID=87088 RepID=UPI001F5F8591|nr:protein FAR1-RELATED SEQUENCE 6-like isoform X1 [Vigna umbellata]